MMRTCYLAFAAAVLATGCAPIHQPEGFLGKLWRLEVGPQYERPAVETPENLLLYPPESALAQTRRDQLVAVVNIYKALGGGWQTPGEEVASR